MLTDWKKQQRQMLHESEPGNTSVAKMAPRATKIVGSERNPAGCRFRNQAQAKKEWKHLHPSQVQRWLKWEEGKLGAGHAPPGKVTIATLRFFIHGNEALKGWCVAKGGVDP